MFLSSLCFLPTSWLVTSSGVPDPSFHMSVSGTLGCFLGENNSKGFFLEPVSVAPSLRVFSLKGFDLHASVRALAEIASGGFETDFNGVFLLFRCDMCDLTRFGSCPYGGLTLPGSCPCFEFLFVDAMLAALPVRCALCGLTQSGSRPSCGLTRRGSCPCFQFYFVFLMIAALLLHHAFYLLRFGSCHSCGFTLLVRSIMLHVSVSWLLDAHEAPSLVGQFKSKKTKIWEAFLFVALCAVFSQVIGRTAGASIAAFVRHIVKFAAVAPAAAISGALDGFFALVGMFESLVGFLALVLLFPLDFAWTIMQATEEVRQQAAASGSKRQHGSSSLLTCSASWLVLDIGMFWDFGSRGPHALLR